MYASVCDRAALRRKRHAMGEWARAVDIGETRRETNAIRKRSLCAFYIGSVMDLHSRRPGMFENSRSSGMWLAEPPSATSLSFLLIRRPCKSLLNAVDVARTYLRPLLAPPSFHDPPPPPVYPSQRRGHQLGAPNSRVTKDAPLAWLGRARLLGAQMMYVDHFYLFSTLALAHGCYSLRFPRSPSTYLCTGTGRRFYRNNKEQ